ncbi:hypothetical protein QUB68_29035 [Microcoleus sp. A006_D1]|uniref:hypothetical protein n=1 Tax=Microcoleus sp. A006_D1 TaxID=3055267 RepID=UPI002FD6A258
MGAPDGINSIAFFGINPNYNTADYFLWRSQSQRLKLYVVARRALKERSSRNNVPLPSKSAESQQCTFADRHLKLSQVLLIR